MMVSIVIDGYLFYDVGDVFCAVCDTLCSRILDGDFAELCAPDANDLWYRFASDQTNTSSG
jgi:hypothetical protein